MANRNTSPAHSEYGEYDGASSVQQQMEAFNKFQGKAERKLNEVETTLQTLTTMMKKMDSRFDAMEAHFLTTRDPNAEFPGTSQNPNQNREQPRSSTTPIQVSTQNLESNRDKSSLGYRAGNLNMTNRDSMLKKIEMPLFTGKQPCIWLIEVERFFHIGRYTDEEKLELVPLSFEGKVRQWYYWELGRKGFRDWTEFKNKLIMRFSESMEETPGKRLFRIKQRGTVEDYISEFEELSSLVPQVDDESLVDIFYNGLSVEMQEVIKIKEPRGLEQHIAAVLRMESSAFCRAISDVPNQNNTTRARKTTPILNTQRNLLTHDSRSGQFQNKLQNKENDSPKAPMRPRQKFTDAELTKMRNDGICFQCGGQWSRAHRDVCPKKELRWIYPLSLPWIDPPDVISKEIEEGRSGSEMIDGCRALLSIGTVTTPVVYDRLLRSIRPFGTLTLLSMLMGEVVKVLMANSTDKETWSYEARDILLDTWTTLLASMDGSGGNAWLPPEGMHAAASLFSLIAESELKVASASATANEDDADCLASVSAMDERLGSYALIARAAVDSTIPFLAKLFCDRVARLHQGRGTVDPTATLEEVYSLLLIIGHVLADEGEGETALVPDVLQSHFVDVVEVGNHPVVILSRSIIKFTVKFMDADMRSSIFSPRLMEAVIWSLARWSFTYLMLVEDSNLGSNQLQSLPSRACLVFQRT